MRPAPRSCHARAPYAPVPSSSFVAPSVSASANTSTRCQPDASRGNVTNASSNSTRPVEPGAFTGVHGRMCFCPVSAIAANQVSWCTRRRKSRIAGLPPLLARTWLAPTTRCVHIRSVSGGRPAMTTTHASQTYRDEVQRAWAWPVKLLPIHRTRSAPRVLAPPHTQHANASRSTASTCDGAPARACTIWLALLTSPPTPLRADSRGRDPASATGRSRGTCRPRRLSWPTPRLGVPAPPPARA